MKVIQGNILDMTSGVICHQVNCKQVAGAGLALQIRRKWPLWYQAFKETAPVLGNVSFFTVNPSLTIANLYAQIGYGKNTMHTDYAAFASCLRVLREKASGQVYIPYGIGCGLAGGDWTIISQTLEAEIPQAILVQYHADKR